MTQSTERRRSPRMPVRGHGEVHIAVKQTIRILDISLTGALFACDLPLPVGSRGRLVASAPGGLLSAPFSVSRRRIEPVSDSYTVAAAFTEIDDNSLRSLEQFLRRGSE